MRFPVKRIIVTGTLYNVCSTTVILLGYTHFPGYTANSNNTMPTVFYHYTGYVYRMTCGTRVYY